MPFSLLHYPRATTTWAIYCETGSLKWTPWSNLMPLTISVVACVSVAQIPRLVGGQIPIYPNAMGSPVPIAGEARRHGVCGVEAILFSNTCRHKSSLSLELHERARA